MAADFPAPHRLLASSLALLGDAKAAVTHLDSAPSTHREPATLACLAYAAGMNGDRTRAGELVEQLDAMARHQQYVSRYYSALACVGAGNADEAFVRLNCACDERDPAIMLLTTDPRFASLRDDARYAALTTRLGFHRENSVHV
jgi:hypothetical protein